MAAAREGSRVMAAVARVMRSKRGMNVDVRYDIDLYFSNLIDYLLDIELNESVKRRDLLRDKTMLLKITSNNGPSIFPINMVSR